MIQTVIVEKEEEIRCELETVLSFHQRFEILAAFDDVNEAHAFLLTHPADVVFVNCEIGDSRNSGDGSYLVMELAFHKPELLSVLYCDDTAKAYDAYQAGCFAFLRTPFDNASLQRVISKIVSMQELLQYKRSFSDRALMIKTKGGHQMVAFQDLLFIERCGHRLRLVTKDQKELYINGYTMDEMQRLLQDRFFYRCYQSFIVNLQRITQVKANASAKSYAIELDGYDVPIELSRDKYNEIVALLRERCAYISI